MSDLRSGHDVKSLVHPVVVHPKGPPFRMHGHGMNLHLDRNSRRGKRSDFVFPPQMKKMGKVSRLKQIEANSRTTIEAQAHSLQAHICCNKVKRLSWRGSRNHVGSRRAGGKEVGEGGGMGEVGGRSGGGRGEQRGIRMKHGSISMRRVSLCYSTGAQVLFYPLSGHMGGYQALAHERRHYLYRGVYRDGRAGGGRCDRGHPYDRRVRGRCGGGLDWGDRVDGQCRGCGHHDHDDVGLWPNGGRAVDQAPIPGEAGIFCTKYASNFFYKKRAT